MKAMIWTKYGPPDVLQLQEVEKPIPKDNEVLIKIYATTVSAGDCELRRFSFPLWIQIPLRLLVGLRRPHRVTILGQELAGEIEDVGKAVTRFKPGDPVFAITGLHLGAYAEYTCLSEGIALAIKPANLDYAEAAAVPLGGLEAWHFLGNGAVRPGEKVLIIGAGGSVGTWGVQLAKYYGAEVTAVDSAGKLDMLRSIGADHVIDYTHEDFTQTGVRYDVVFDVVGKGSVARGFRLLTEHGRYLLGNQSPSALLQGQWLARNTDRQFISGSAQYNGPDDLMVLKELIEAGKARPVIDRRYPLEQLAEAHRYVETGVKKGTVVITLDSSSRG
jgi:NADPH:quinone reductase-like Zn-dependent oxidoreductase